LTKDRTKEVENSLKSECLTIRVFWFSKVRGKSINQIFSSKRKHQKKSHDFSGLYFDNIFASGCVVCLVKCAVASCVTVLLHEVNVFVSGAVAFVLPRLTTAFPFLRFVRCAIAVASCVTVLLHEVNVFVSGAVAFVLPFLTTAFPFLRFVRCASCNFFV